MKSRADRLEPVSDIARKREKEALENMAEKQGRLAKGQELLEELKRYRDDYVDPSIAVSIESLMNRRRFLDRIVTVIDRQNLEVSRLQRQFDHARSLWLVARANQRAIGLVIERQREVERKTLDRREQADTDERILARRAAQARAR